MTNEGAHWDSWEGSLSVHANRRLLPFFSCLDSTGEPMKQFCTFLLFTAIVLVSTSVVSTNDAPRWPMFEKHQIDAGANEAATVADINHDGRPDIVSGENWYEAPEWKKHRMREIPFLNGYIDDFSNHPLDVNGDGYVDIVACAWFSKRMTWYENPRRYDGELANTLWKEHVIESNFNYELMLMVDIDGDGKAQEFLPNYGSSPEIAWWERSELSAKGEWVRHSVGQVPEARGLHGVGAGDLNGDKRPDILTAKGWFEAPANPRTGTWTFHPDFQLLPPRGQCGPIYAHDVNGDGKTDVVYSSGHQYGVFWLENLGGKWKTHAIDDSWSQAHAFTISDLDHDGKLDIITGKRYLAHDIDPGAYEPLGVYWYRSTGDGSFVKHVIDYGSKVGGGMQIPVLDIDGDGDLDLVAPGKSGLFLFEQVNPQRQKAAS
jgi:VCBS repeat protein